MEVDIQERKKDLEFLRSEPLNMKIQGTIAKVLEFWQYTNGNCYLSYSGGADSTVLKDIIEKEVEPFLNCKIKKVFDDTGLEEPSVRDMAINNKDIIIVKPKKSFYQVLSEVGYPVISKEVSECVNNARRYFDNLSALRERERERERESKPKYYAHYKKLFGVGEYATTSSKVDGPIKEKGFP